MTTVANVEQYPRARAYTKAQRWGLGWRILCPILVVGVFFLVNNYHNQRVAKMEKMATRAAVQAKIDQAKSLEEGKRLGRNRALGHAQELVVPQRYVFHGVHTIRGKTFALLTGPDDLEPQLYRLDRRQFPQGFPGEGGAIRPVSVNGYFEPVGGKPKPVVRRAARKAVHAKPARSLRPVPPSSFRRAKGAIRRSSSAATLPAWPFGSPGPLPRAFGPVRK